MKTEALQIVLTGATGFIGSAVLKELVSRGHRAVVLARNSSNLQKIAALPADILSCDQSESDLAAMLRDRHPDVFIHLAWKGVYGDDRNEEYQISDNLSMSMRYGRIAAQANCKSFIGVGSQAEYGNPNRKTRESDPTHPTTIYGKSKLACCHALSALMQAHGVKFAWLRIFSTYGPGDDRRWFIPYVLEELSLGRSPKLTKCEQLWDYLYVDDAARAIVDAAEKHITGIFNLGSGQAVPLRQIVEIMTGLMQAKALPDFGAVPYRDDQVMHLEADVSLLQHATGWRPLVSLEEGLRRTKDAMMAGMKS